MTEPLLMALTTLAAWLGIEAFRYGRCPRHSARRPRPGGRVPDAVRSLAVRGARCWLLGVPLGARPGRGPSAGAIVIAGRLAAYPAAAVAGVSSC